MTTNLKTKNTTSLEIGEKVDFCKAPYVVGGVNNGQIQLTHADTNVMQLLTWQQMEEEYRSGNIRFPERSGAGSRITVSNDNFQQSFDLCPDEHMEYALRMKAYMEAIRSEYSGRIPNKELVRISYEVAETIVDSSPPSKDTLRNYLKRWDASGGDVRSLLPRTHMRGNRKSKLDPAFDVMIFDAVANVYARPEQPSSTAVYNALCKSVSETNEKLLPQDRLSMPSKRTLLKAIRKRMGPEMVARRKGEQAANRQFRPVYNRPRAMKPLECVQIDTKTLDVFVLKGGKAKRPYLTALLDEFSGCIVGYYIGLEPPCAENVLKCMHHAINYKDSKLASEGKLNSSYDCHGLFSTLIGDNGSEFKNDLIVHVLSQFGVNVQWCEAATPEQKARIERFFRTIDLQLFHDLPGTTKGNVKDRGDYKAHKEATLTLGDVRELFEKYLVDVYHQSYHRGVKGVPAQMWAEGVVNDPPRMPGSIFDLAAFLPNIDGRVIQSKGIEFKTNFYNSPELAVVRNGEKGKRVRIRWDDTDLSHIFVENPETRQYFKVPSVNLAKTEGLTAEAQEAEMKAENECRRQADQDPMLVKSKGELSDMTESKRKELPAREPSQKPYNPFGKSSKEVEIQNQNAAIPPSGQGFADLEAGSEIVSLNDDAHQNIAHCPTPANENVSDDDNMDEWAAQNGRTIAGEG